MSRETLLEATKLIGRSTPLGGEIEHFMTLDERDYAYDEVSALFGAYHIAIGNRDDVVIRAARRLLIAHGFYRVMTQYEIDNTFNTNGRKVWDFVHAGLKYTTDHTFDDWEWPDEAESTT